MMAREASSCGCCRRFPRPVCSSNIPFANRARGQVAQAATTCIGSCVPYTCDAQHCLCVEPVQAGGGAAFCKRAPPLGRWHAVEAGPGRWSYS